MIFFSYTRLTWTDSRNEHVVSSLTPIHFYFPWGQAAIFQVYSQLCVSLTINNTFQDWFLLKNNHRVLSFLNLQIVEKVSHNMNKPACCNCTITWEVQTKGQVYSLFYLTANLRSLLCRNCLPPSHAQSHSEEWKGSETLMRLRLQTQVAAPFRFSDSH